MKKPFTLILLLLISILVLNTSVQANSPGDVLFIGQVRGQECCSPGSLENLQNQIKQHIKYNIPIILAFRYDALINSSWMEIIKEYIKDNSSLITPAILFEITPQLAKDSGVKHKITNDTWYEAQNIFSVGYPQEDRIKIANKLFNTFFEVFNSYPTISSAWMIDTQTLNYIHNNFGVKIFQITREQYGVDSYTLYGGPPHYPYPASRNWLFILNYDFDNPVLIVRQTVSDPLYNYGDDTSTFTSQPNDYLRGDKDISYFKKLLNYTIARNNTGRGFANLGLENSMDKKYQDEYFKQIKIIRDYSNLNKVKLITDLEDFYNYWRKQKITIYDGEEDVGGIVNRAAWITTPNYRIRMILQGSRLSITDLRVYDKEFKDPYYDKQALKSGYWIVPYLIDGSVEREENNNSLLDFFKKKKIDSQQFIVRHTNDIKNHNDRISLPDISDNQSYEIEKNKDNISIKYKSLNNKIIRLKFFENQIYIENVSEENLKPQINDHSSNELIVDNNKKSFKIYWKNEPNINLLSSNDRNNWTLKFNSNKGSDEKLRKINYPLFFPEPLNHKIDNRMSYLIAHNQYAVAGRNPVRLFLVSRDKYGLPIILLNKISIITEKKLTKNIVVSNLNKNLIQYIDLYSDLPLKTKLKIKIDNEFIYFKKNVYFAPNCKLNIEYCIRHPIEAYWYFRSFLGDKFRK